jgi:hypothetical protein
MIGVAVPSGRVEKRLGPRFSKPLPIPSGSYLITYYSIIPSLGYPHKVSRKGVCHFFAADH